MLVSNVPVSALILVGELRGFARVISSWVQPDSMRLSNSTVYSPVVLSKLVTGLSLFVKRLSLKILVPIQWGSFGKLYLLLALLVVTVLEVFASCGERH